MENRIEDEIKKRWAEEAKDKQDAESSRPRKRPREIEYNTNGFMGALTHRLLGSGALDPVAGASKAKAKKKPAGKATRARGKVTEITEEDEEYIDLD